MVSALTGEGFDALLSAIDARLGSADALLDVTVPAGDGRTLAWLYTEADVVSRVAIESGDTKLSLRIPSERRERLLAALKKAGVPAGVRQG